MLFFSSDFFLTACLLFCVQQIRRIHHRQAIPLIFLFFKPQVHTFLPLICLLSCISQDKNGLFPLSCLCVANFLCFSPFSHNCFQAGSWLLTLLKTDFQIRHSFDGPFKLLDFLIVADQILVILWLKMGKRLVLLGIGSLLLHLDACNRK